MSPGGFSHEAFLYSDTAEFLQGAASFVREGLALGEEVLVAVSGQRLVALHDELGDEPGLELQDMAVLGANPARIIPAWQEFLDGARVRGRRARGLGEPIWADRSTEELAEWHQHELLLNLAFEDGEPWRLLCPYDVSALAGEDLDLACANHPVIVAGRSSSESPTYHPGRAPRALRGQPLPPPPEGASELEFLVGELASVRSAVSLGCATLDLPGDLVDDFVLAVDEVAGNSLLHGGGRGVLRIWSDPSTVVCEIRDEGVIRDPLVGRTRPRLDSVGGRGLWLVNQLCDLVQVRSGAAGTVVRMHVRRH